MTAATHADSTLEPPRSDERRLDVQLFEAVAHPDRIGELSPADWDQLLRRARLAGLLSRMAVRAKELDAQSDWPEKVRDIMAGARAVAEHHARSVRWEVNRICRALRPIGVKPVLLKGAAYILADLPPARGRIVSDVDILVPKSRLRTVEQALLDHGWEHIHLDAYDQRYYRQWMHELPPLRHRLRQTVIDVHHTILPESGRLHPDARKLLNAARPIGTDPNVLMLAPHDMVLHAAAHFFEDGELTGGLRDLMDIRDLLEHFGENDPAFWNALVPRAREMHLHRPLYYALHLVNGILDAQLPTRALAGADVGGPMWPIGPAVQWMARRALAVDAKRYGSFTTGLASLLLYTRAHWLRMPPGLLARHLFRKSLRRWFGEEEPDDHDRGDDA